MAVYKTTSQGVFELTGQELEDWKEVDRLATETASEKKSAQHRFTRDTLLSQTDWTQMNDSPLSNEDKTAWATYRQELRDITSHSNWPDLSDDDWPTKS